MDVPLLWFKCMVRDGAESLVHRYDDTERAGHPRLRMLPLSGI
jgi:hypothetical protein